MTTNRKRHLTSEFVLFETSSIQFHLICQMLAKFSGVESDRTVSKVRKRKFLCSVLSLRLKLGSFTSQSYNDGQEMCKKARRTCKVVVLLA